VDVDGVPGVNAGITWARAFRIHTVNIGLAAKTPLAAYIWIFQIQDEHQNWSVWVDEELFLLGVDGGGTRCRARLCGLSGTTLGEGLAGPANIRLGLKESFTAVLEATAQCLAQAGLSVDDHHIIACLALAGASEPSNLAAARRYNHPFRRAVFTTDAHAACVGAHRGRDGGVIIIGTGTIGWAIRGGRHYRVGGWGFPISDEGSGAWLGCEVIRRVLWAHDGRISWTSLLNRVSERFKSDPHAIVRWMSSAKPGDFGGLAPLVVEHAAQNDLVGCELMRLAAGYIDGMAERLGAFGVSRLALTGGLGFSIEPWLSRKTKSRLVPAAADALTGAVQLARAAARSAALAG
jgi:glucosamine kinase